MRSACFALACVLLLTACHPGDTRPDGQAEPGLDAWLDGDLAPFLIRQLSEHPRLRGESVWLVGRRGEDLRGRIDGLTREIRARLADRLMTVPGLRLGWHPGQPLPGTLPGVCPGSEAPGLYLGIEVLALSGGRVRVSLRALDPREGQWVPGLARSWQGRVGAGRLAALGRVGSDLQVRGLREFPFQTGELDLAARFLARRLACGLRQSGIRRVTLDRSVSQGQEPSPDLGPLLLNYLAGDPGLAVVEPALAQVSLHTEVHSLGAGLRQLWVVSRPLAETGRAPGAVAVYQRASTATASPVGESSGAVREAALLGPLEVVEPDDCVNCAELRVRARRTAWVFLIEHQAGRLPRRVAGESCHVGPWALARGEQLRVRVAEGRRADTAWFAMATDQHATRRRLTRMLSRLGDRCGDGGDLGWAELQGWLARLDGLLAGRSGVWRQVSLGAVAR